MGVEVVTVEHGLQALETLLAGSPAQIAVMPGAWPHMAGSAAYSSRWPFLAELTGVNAEMQNDAGAPKLALELRQASPAQRRQILLNYIRELLGGVLGLDKTDKIDPRRPLNELGVDSLMAIEMKNALSDAMGSPLPSTLVFEYPTLESLAGHLASLAGADDHMSASAPETDYKREDLDTILAGIESLSEDEAEALLARPSEATGD